MVPSIVALIVILAGVAAMSLTLLKHMGVLAATPLPYNATANGPYSVQGNTIVGADGKQYIFHGIGRDGLEYNCSGEGPLDKQSLSYLGSGTSTATATYWGANTVRLPLSEGFWLKGAPGYPCSAAQYQALVKQTVDNLTALKLNVIIDLQWVDAAGQSGQGGGPWASPDADSVTFWSQVAPIYQSYSNVLFELYNEPYPSSWACWKSGGCSYTNLSGYSNDCQCTKTVSYQAVGMQDLVTAVRNAGANNLVLAGGVGWGYDLSQLNNYSLTGSNIVYDTHPYPYAGKMPANWDASFGTLSSKYPMISAENGEYDCATSYLSQLYDYLDAHQIGWVAWAWYAQPSGSHANACGYPQLIYDYQGTPAISTGQYVYQRLQSYNPAAPTPTPMPTPSATPVQNGYNNTGISNNNASKAANYDGGGASYSAQTLQSVGINPGSVVTAGSFAYIWPNVGAGASDNYRSAGQTIAVAPVAHADHLGLLGSATNGAASGSATINYTDGSTQTFTAGLTDWAKSTPSFGNTIAAGMSTRNIKTGTQALNVYLFSASVALQAGKTVQSVTLPTTVLGGQLHVFAISTSSLTAPTYNNVGITNDGNVGPGNYDRQGNSYSTQALQSAGLNVSGTAYDPTRKIAFAWPHVSAGSVNNYQAAGQVIAVTPVANATLLAFLGSASNGASTGTATITYTDGSTQTFGLGFSDWTLNGGKVSPSYGNTISYTSAYRSSPHVSGGKLSGKAYIFYTSVPLQAGKTIANVALPATVSGGQMHVFAVTTH
ncbi:MAG: cellulase family glycosylhydrolase [Ktedonobacteraceae bacterium]|nr:cellulase family glycosylhydrolase [Ktedonobacteraceae bacterium]